MKTIAKLLVCMAAVVAPAALDAQIAVVSNTIEERTAAPGERYTGSILLRNSTGEPQEAEIYATDYAFSANGQTTYAAAGTTSRSSANWIAVDRRRVVIPARGDAVVSYAVTVPQRADMNGTFWSLMMVETIDKASLQSSMQSKPTKEKELGLRTTVRYGIQVVTHMADAGSRSVVVRQTRLVESQGGGRVLEFDIANTGERAYRPALTAELYDEAGNLAARFQNARGLIYPGSSVHQKYDVPKLARGNYKVLIIADTGADELFAAQYRLTL